MASAHNSVGSALPQVPINMPVSTYQHQTSASPTNYSFQTNHQLSGGYTSQAYRSEGTERRVTSTTTGNERLESVRKVSSTIVEESYLGPLPQDLPVQQIDLPTIEEKETRVVKKEKRYKTEIKKLPPTVEYKTKIVEVPRVKKVPVVHVIPVPEPVIVDKKVTVYVDREVPFIVEKPKIIVKTVEKERPVPQPYDVVKYVNQPVDVMINRYTDRQVPMVIAQTIKPYIVEGQGEYEVDVVEYEAEVQAIDIHVIKPVATNIEAHGVVDTFHRVITAPAAQYNTMLQQLNSHLSQAELQKLPYVVGANGTVQFLSETIEYSSPQAGVEIQGWNPATAVNTWVGERVTQQTSMAATTSLMTGEQMSAQMTAGGQLIQHSGGVMYSPGTITETVTTGPTHYSTMEQEQTRIYSSTGMGGMTAEGGMITTTQGPIISTTEYSSSQQPLQMQHQTANSARYTQVMAAAQ